MPSMLTLTRDDLLTDISAEELDGIANELLEQGQADPVNKGITESLALLQMYIDPLKVQDDVVKRIWRLLSISGLYNRLTSIPDKRKEERAWCMKTLAEIRDGKFPNLMLNPETATTTSTGAWGSAPYRNVSPFRNYSE